MNIELIKWIDAVGADGWVKLKEINDTHPTVFETVGFMVSEDKHCVRVSMSEDTDLDNYGAYMVIPKINIVKRQIIKKA